MSFNCDRYLQPEPLKRGDTIGVIAPASFFDIEKFNIGIGRLLSAGFNVHIPNGLFKRFRYFAGEDLHRARIINELFRDDDIDALLCVRGGFGSMRILPFIDYDGILRRPKLFVGFSDISAMLANLFHRCGLICFHGPTLTSMGELTADAFASFITALSSFLFPSIVPENPVTLSGGCASGRLIGGNLTTLCHLIGTPFDIDYSGRILFFEETKESSYRIDRMLCQFKMAGKFDQIKGLVLGNFHQCGAVNEIYDIVGEVFKDLSIPILTGFDIGHIAGNITMPVGMTALLDADSQVLSFI